MQKLIFLSLAFSAALLASCEKNISISPRSAPPILVIEAMIESGNYPIVVISNSFGLFSDLSVEMLTESFIHNAQVSISDGTRDYPLKEFSVPTGPGVTYYYYSVDPQTSNFRGSFGKNYSLNIAVDGKNYSAQTTIPTPKVRVDSISWKQALRDDSSKLILLATLTDPPGYGNYFRYYTKVNNAEFYPGFFSVVDDQITDGKQYTVEVDRGVDRNSDYDPETYTFFDRGSSVTIKISEIDKSTYDFWRTFEFSLTSIGNPFSSPTKVLGNIRGGALGYFGGYASQLYTIKLPD